MKWSFRIARVAGIDVNIHVTFFLLLGFYAWYSHAQGGWPMAWFGLAFILLLFVCVLLHEFGHAFAAKLFGIRTPDITLLPIGGVARLERMPRNPFQELVIALAGPAVNVAIAMGLVLVLGPLFNLHDVLELDRPGLNIFSMLAVVNILLVVFNMIPAFPMDGGRVLRSILAMRLPHARATTIAARVGQVIAVAFALLGVFTGNIILILIAVFVFFGAQQELAIARIYSAVPENARVADIMITQFASLPSDLPLESARRLVLQTMQPVFPVVGNDLRVLGLLRREDLIFNRPGAEEDLRPLGELVKSAKSIAAEADCSAAIETMQQNHDSVLAVTNASGQIVGLVTLAMLMERARGA